MLNNPNFLKNLQKFDRESIEEQTIEKIKIFIDNPKFQPENIRRASRAAEGLCKWVRALYGFYWVNTDIKPKKEKLKEATEELRFRFERLKVKQEELEKIEKDIQQLTIRYNIENDEKQRLKKQIDSIELKLGRTVKLMDRLTNERNRWKEQTEKLTEATINLTGDILLSSGFISYLGPFMSSYREFSLFQE